MRLHFFEYFPRTEEEKKVIWDDAIFVFDTNVLLKLYRTSRDTCAAILSILKKLKGRLFLPHQVGVEFFKHREEEIAIQVNTFESMRRYLKKVSDSFVQSFPRHACLPIPRISESLKSCAEAQIAEVNKFQEAHHLNYLHQAVRAVA